VSAWPFDDVRESLGRWMALVSHRWPGITPFNVEQLSVSWWAYYVRAAMDYQQQVKEANRGR
jgi:hypothetical protein